ncbi:hypothetical protein [Janthinobacterium sp.]|uniref:hypothetical protein n=1 Tax=Janthinobacterium sp. TaxID=1871054 RepID=UPI002589116D|nr:hypothetical protein [Janthinobacterium sp.]MCX7290955.1 hypothetical protein [Janthinobacterium sp.]
MKITLKIVTCLSIVLSASAYATSPCEGDACIDSASASFIAPHDVFEAKCSAVKPEMHTRYSAVVAYFIRNEDATFLRKLRESRAYAAVRGEFELKVDAMSTGQLTKACEEFLNEPSAKENQLNQKH